jgi:hypothetical protein
MENHEAKGRGLVGIGVELVGAKLGDLRRSKRAAKLVETIADDPSASFPSLFDRAGTEAFYRFVNNDDVTLDGLVEGHATEACVRATEAREVLAIHDTTRFEFHGGPVREGLGWLKPDKGKANKWKGQTRWPGFLGHFTLLVTADGTRRPLGVSSLIPVNRTGPPRAKGRKARLSGAQYARLGSEEKESIRWLEGVERTERRLAGRAAVIHVMDREGDSFGLLHGLVQRHERFVIRANYDRKVGGETETTLWDELERAKMVLTRTVPLSRRKGSGFAKDAGRHPPRLEREAKLRIGWCRVTLAAPKYLRKVASNIELNVVLVREVDPPDGHGVEWVLYTTEPVDTAEDVARVVDIYQARWLIEEFFRALKTGCRYEERQLESYDALLRALGLLVPVAWKLLELRSWARTAPQASATEVLTETQIDVLSALCPKRNLGPKPTVRAALLAVASLGGHLPNNGEPGWLVLHRGWERLVAATLGWEAARGRRDGGVEM